MAAVVQARSRTPIDRSCFIPARASSTPAGIPPRRDGLQALITSLETRFAKRSRYLDPLKYPCAIVGAGEFGIPFLMAVTEQMLLPATVVSTNEATVRHFKTHGWHPDKHNAVRFLPKGDLSKVAPFGGSKVDVNVVNGLDYTTDYGELTKKKIIFLCVPGKAVRDTITKIKAAGIPKDVILVSLMKTFIGQRVTRVLQDAFPENPVAYVGGLSSDRGLKSREVTTLAVAANRPEVAETLGTLINQHIGRKDITQMQYVYAQIWDDMLGLELAGVLKNIVAMGAGICEGYGYNQDNAVGTLVEIGFDEMKRLISAVGGKSESMDVRAAAADFEGTCLRNFSRNKEYGIFIGETWRKHSRPPTPEEIAERFRGRTVEALTTLEFLVRELSVDPYWYTEFPVLAGTYEVVFNAASPLQIKDVLLPLLRVLDSRSSGKESLFPRRKSRGKKGLDSLK